jgi:hypothetical protein
MTDDLFVPLTPPNPAAPKPKCRRHVWLSNGLDTFTFCRSCGRTRNPDASRRGKNNRQRGNAIEREIGKTLGMKRVGQYGGKDDLSNALFSAQVKSGGAFSERQWAWLKAVPVVAGQTQLLVVADTPGPGKKRRAVVILDLDDWRELHGQIGADEP